MIPHQVVPLDICGHRLVAIAGNQSKTGTPVIFIHGITASVQFWIPSLPASVLDDCPWYSLSLPAHFPAIAPECFHPNDVTPEWFAELLGDAIVQLVGNQPVKLVGHSTGAFSALILAALRPRQVRAVLCISGFAQGCWAGLLGLLQLLAGRGRWESWIFQTSFRFGAWLPHHYILASALLTANYRTFLQNSAVPRMLEPMRLDVKQHNWEHIRWLFAALASMDIQPLLAKIRAPVSIITGEKDPIVPINQALLLKSHIPEASLEILPGIGHMVLAECTTAYQQLLTDWVTGSAILSSGQR